MTPIRLAHICSSDLAIPALMPFCTPLLARGWEITMITPDGPHVASGRAAGLAWRPLALRRRMHAPSDVVGTLQLASYCLRDRYDIVHTHNIKAGHIGRVVAMSMRVPVIVHTVHGMAYSLDMPWPKRTAHALLERFASLDCDLVFSQSREDRDTLLASHAVSAERLVVIGNGIDLRRFDAAAPSVQAVRDTTRAALGIRPEEIVFLSAGRLIREKGFIELFEATERANRDDPRIRLAVAGPTDERADALDQGILDRARAAGILLLGARSDMPALYAASDVVVLASWHEGMPRVLMEGAAMGKPLLTTDVRGCREVVEPPRHGLRVPVRDAEALAGAMRQLAADEPLRTRLGIANAIEARERYAIGRAVSLVNEAYDRLLASR
ncbi:MAG: glycosyltransferase family 4 protein [Deltaproteobacteria bacterium]|nr:glycosyltransferase family 4 protein [Deltaproteobacteria bacterium]